MQTAQAVDSLAETGGNVTTTAQLAFKDVALKDVGTMYALRARMQGSYITESDRGMEATFFNRQETYEGGVLVKVSYQLQVIDAGYAKAPTVEFIDGDGGVYAKLKDGNFTNYGNINAFGTEPLTSNSAASDYVPYDLKLVEPVVRSINVNFCYNANEFNTSSSVRYGAGDYAVPYSAWNNMTVSSGSSATFGGATFKQTTTSGRYRCQDLSSSKDLRYGYLDDSGLTVVVDVTNIPYEHYRIITYHATDNADIKFGYVTINGTDYTGTTDATAKGNSSWGATGAANKAKGLREGVNYLVSDVMSGSSVTITGHRDKSKSPTCRGCIAAVQIVEVITDTYTATIDAAGTKNFSDLSWDTALPASLSGAKLVLNVEEDAIVNIDSAIDASAVEFNVAEGKTLTLSGNTITAGAIAVKGAGAVALGSASQFAGTLRGNGTVVYDGFRPTGATFTDQAWTGTLWVKNIASDSSDRVDFALQNYGNAGSTLRFTNVNLYFPNDTTTAFPGTVDLDGAGMNVCDGYGGSIATIARLTGTGTLSTGGGSANGNGLTINDASGFAGTFNLTKFKVIVGTATSTSASGVLIIESGATATVAAGKAWSAAGGITVDGTLVLAASDSGMPTVSGGSGAIVCNDKLPNNSGLSANTWTGNVTVNGGATTAAGIAAANAASFMNAGSTFTVASGTVVLGTGAGLTGEVDVLSGATLTVVDDSTTAFAIDFGTLEGNVNLSACSALETLTLGLDSYRGSGIVYPSTLQALNLSLSETLAEDGVISIPVSGLSSGATVNATITDQNGQAKAGAVAVSGTTATVTFAPAVSGKACWCDYEMDYVSGNAAKSGFENSGTDTTNLSADSGITGDNAFYNGMLYTYAHPYRGVTYPSDGNWTAVVRCTVPAYENAAVITFGTRSAGLIGLVAGADPETEMRLVQTTGDSHFITNSTMTVQDATTAQHVYIFSVETNQTVKVYCDGELVLDKTFDAPFTLGPGMQVGSVHGGVGSTAIVRFAKNESPAKELDEMVQKNARIDCVRLYDRVLGPKAVQQLSVEFPAVKLFRATVANGETTDWNSLSWTPAWDGGNNVSKIILTVEGDATLTLPASITAEDFFINVAEGATLTLLEAAGGTTVAARNPVEVNTGVVKFSGATATLGYTIVGTGTVALDADLTLEVPSGGANVRSLALPESGTVTLKLSGDSLADGEYTLLTSQTDLPANFMTHLAVDVPATESEMCLVSTDNRTVKLLVGSPTTAGGLYVWTGKALDGKTDTAGNWFGGAKPPAGADVYISSVAAVIENDIEGFAPATITFGDGAGAVTIGGSALTGVASVANLSAMNHTFNAPVHFSGNIQVKQAADHFENLGKAHVTFAGGAYAASGSSIETGSTVNWSRCMFGNYSLDSTSDSRWTATSYEKCRPVLAGDSLLYVPYAGDLKELQIESGAKVDVDDMKLTSKDARVAFRNNGEVVVTNLTLTGSGDRFATCYQDASVPSVFKFESITNSMSDNWLYFADSKQASKHVFYIGAGGLNYKDVTNSGGYCFGRNTSGNVEMIRPWYSDFTIADKDGGTQAYGIVMGRNVVFCTDDESGTGRKITIDTPTKSRWEPAITVSGSGTLQVNKTCDNDAQPTVVVTNTATLAFKPGASLGTGATTVHSGATLAVSESGTNTVASLTLKGGAALAFNFTDAALAPVLAASSATAEGAVNVKISALGVTSPAFGKHVLTSSGGAFAGKTVTCSEKPSWSRTVSVGVVDGEIVMSVPRGTLIFVR